MPSSTVQADRRAVGRLACLQGGCVARWQLVWLGLATSTITRLVRREGLTIVHAGVFRLPGVTAGPVSDLWAAVLALSPQDGPTRADRSYESHVDPVTAAYNAARSRVVVTGLSAAWRRGLLRRPPRLPHLLTATPHHPRRRGLTVTRAGIVPEMWTWLDGLSVATGPRLFWDVAWTQRHAPGGLGRLMDLATTADRMRVLAVDELLALVDEPVLFGLPRRPPRLLRQTAEELRPGFSHSRTEALARRIAEDIGADLGVRVEPRPFAVWADGRIVAEADIAIVELRHDIEIDGPHHDLPSQRTRYRRRDDGLRLIDWTVDRHPVRLIDKSAEMFATRLRTDLRCRLDNRNC